MGEPLEKNFRTKVAIGLASTLLTCLIFLASSWGKEGRGILFENLLLAMLFLYNPLIILSFLFFGSAGGVIAMVLSSILGLLISILARSSLYYLSSASFLTIGMISHIICRREMDFQRKKEVYLEKMEADYNVLRIERAKKEEVRKGWRKRMLKYSVLREMTESLSSTLGLEKILSLVTDSALYLIGKGETALLFLMEEGKLALRATSHMGDSPEARARVIKSKTGDAFDRWVLKQRQNLIVTDAEKDFRFRTSVKETEERKTRSLISSPILKGKEMRGMLRLDSSLPEVYYADDLRLLDILANLVSLAIENAELYRRTEELAIRDNLTGLYVHEYFQNRLEEELKRALIRNYSLSLVMLDLDHLKDYNDQFGHIAGDIVLRHLAKILADEVGEGGVSARYGGEEFCFLLPRTGKEEARQLAERIRKKVAEHTIAIRRRETKVTVSIGIATLPDDARMKTELIRKADEALYRAKEGGRDRVCL